MRDITERLRGLYVLNGTNYVQEAADEIERLRGVLQQIAKIAYDIDYPATEAVRAIAVLCESATDQQEPG